MNYATSYGGAIYNRGTLTTTNSTFDGNEAEYEGGVIASMGNLTISDSTFINNKAESYGVLINMWGNVSIVNSSFISNANGTLYNRQGYLEITSSIFASNTINNTDEGVAILNAGTLVVTDSIFINNSATYKNSGDAIYNYNQTGYNVTMELNDNKFISEVSTPVNESISLVVPIINEVYSSATEENVTYTIDSEEYNVTKTNSEISIDYTFDTLGQYTVIVDYDDDNLYVIDVDVLNKANIIVDEIPTQIVYTNTTITGTLVDNEGNPISGRQVVAILVTANTSIIVDSVVTDENGRWAFNFTLNDAGEYILYVGSK